MFSQKQPRSSPRDSDQTFTSSCKMFFSCWKYFNSEYLSPASTKQWKKEVKPALDSLSGPVLWHLKYIWLFLPQLASINGKWLVVHNIYTDLRTLWLLFTYLINYITLSGLEISMIDIIGSQPDQDYKRSVRQLFLEEKND